MGSFVPLLGSGYAAPSTRWCPRCGARLSRYASQSETMCAPCQGVVHPWIAPLPRTPADELERRRLAWAANDTLTCECGAPKSRGAQSCVHCYIARISNKDPWHGPDCPHCGGHKAIDARMCHHCRYPGAA
jgi:hypothetical protein